ncbi:MAG: hypothetical protein LBS08_02225 [Candidatus Symbiothrix sp.]|jgi:hypothetical protein|nr:hypothetical protein [Candidatus Symbiothrix sp.]
MTKRIIYIGFIVVLFLLLYRSNKDSNIQYLWKPTFKTTDKQPFGAYALDKMLSSSWENDYYHNYENIWDLCSDTTNIYYNLLIIANEFQIDRYEYEILYKYIEHGGSAVIVAGEFSSDIEIPFNLRTNFHVFWNELLIQLNIKQSSELVRFTAPNLKDEICKVPISAVNRHFESLDTMNYKHIDSVFAISEIHDTSGTAAKNRRKILSLRYQIGKGNLVLACNPLLFTNYGILNDSINTYVWNHLAYLQGRALIRTEYYEAGSQGAQSQSPFRVILSERSLRWAFYITLICIAVFMIFTARRKQKAIPVIKPPANRSLEFVRSIAGLYLQKNNNADIILKKQIYWGDALKRKYGIDVVNEPHDYDFYKRVAAKTRTDVNEVRRLFIDLGVIDAGTFVSDEEMMVLIERMNQL